MNWEDELYRHHGPLGLPFHFWTLFVAIFGAMTGSFLNVVIHRMPRGESIVTPRSHCPHCQTPLGWRDLVPVLSFLWLRGRCGHCAVPISARYPTVEVVVGLAWGLCAWHWGISFTALAWAGFFTTLLALALKRAMNFCRWAILSCCLENAVCCSAICSARMSSNLL